MNDLWIIVVAILAALTTYYINIYLGKGPVFSSAVVTLVSGIFFPYFVPKLGANLAAVATSASYAAMVAKTKFPKISEMIFVGLIVGIVFISALSATAFAGVGGKLGTIAAISGLTWLGIKSINERATSGGKVEKAA